MTPLILEIFISYHQESHKSSTEEEKPPQMAKSEIFHVIEEKLSSNYTEWKGVNEDEITVKDVSGQGGDSTYHVSRVVGDDVIAEVAFHVVGQKAKFENHPKQLHIQKLVTELFGNAGISPRRLAEDEDRLFVNEWIKDAKNINELGSDLNIEIAKELGKLLSKVHSIDTSWYEPFYNYWIEQYPELSIVPRGSSFWYLTGRNWPLLFGTDHKGSMDKYMKQLVHDCKAYVECEVQPLSSAGKAIVTTHGDYHLGNIIVTESKNFYVVDFEQTHVSSAIQDISYFFFAFPGCSDSKSFKLEFCASYLKEMGRPHEESDAFALALDAERCRFSVGFMSPLFEAFVHQEKAKEEDKRRVKLMKVFADTFVKDQSKVAKILETANAWSYAPLDNQLPFVCVGNNPEVGALLTIGKPSLEDDENKQEDRFQFLFNGDGTIMPKNGERWRGLVLGADESGDVFLVNHCNREKRIKISDEILKNISITGYPTPKVKSFPMLLKDGEHSGKGIIRSKDKNGHFMGNEWCKLTVGDSKEAIHVHFEKSGAIRLADRTEQSFDCESGQHKPGTEINIYQHQDTEEHQFVRNEDDTISPKKNLDVIITLKEGILALEEKEKATNEQRLVFDIPEAIGYISLKEESDSADQHKDTNKAEDLNPFTFLLENPNGKGIGFKLLELDDDIQPFMAANDYKDSLSSLKICIVDQDDAARCQIDPKNYYIKLTSTSLENDVDVISGVVPVNMIRYGCWN